jgi:hypothetical protein
MKTQRILIQQLDENGNVFRTFTKYVVPPKTVETAMEEIARAFNMEHTKVTVF